MKNEELLAPRPSGPPRKRDGIGPWLEWQRRREEEKAKIAQEIAAGGDAARRDPYTGCYRVKHGEGRNGQSAEYSVWRGIRRRCHDESHVNYPSYGGKGIRVCDEWRNDFSAFLAHVGRKPSPAHTLDRFPNRDGNYESGNVRWATREEQTANRRVTRWVEFNGEKMPLAWFARRSGIPSSTALNYYLSGRDPMTWRPRASKAVRP